MKLKLITLLSLSVVISACGKRQSPDELSVIKYDKLVIPNKLVLVKPTENQKGLGYKDSRNVVYSISDINKDKKLDVAILSKFKIRKTDNNIKQIISDIKDSKVVVNIKGETARIKKNIDGGKSITSGETPSINIRNAKSGVDELFSD